MNDLREDPHCGPSSDAVPGTLRFGAMGGSARGDH